MLGRLRPVVEIRFDKVVGHLFIDSVSLVTHEVPPVDTEQRNFANLTCSDHSKLLSQTPSNIFLK